MANIFPFNAFFSSFHTFILVSVIFNVASQKGDFPSENYDDCIDLVARNADELMRMGPNSKYFIMTRGVNIPLKEAKGLCESMGLQPAEIRHNFELLSIETFLSENAPPNTMVGLGVNDDKREGEFVEYDGTPMQFHAFAEGQPDNRMNMESCVILMRHPILLRWVYMDVTCDTAVTPICMYKTGDKCFYSSPLTAAKVPQGFEMVGSSSMRDYYVGLRQYPMDRAAAECRKAGYELVDFDTGLNNNQMLYDMIRKWINRNFLFSRTAFWTGGVLEQNGYSETDGGPQYVFKSSGKYLNDLYDWPSLEWDDDEPSDTSGLNLEQCISVRLYKPYVPSGNIYHLSTTNCRIPHYPLCYKDKLIGSGKTKERSALKGRRGKSSLNKYCPMDDIKVNLTNAGLSYEEILKLATASRYTSLSGGNHFFAISHDKPWLANSLAEIFLIAESVCPTNIVPVEYTHFIHNLVVVYYNSLETIEDPKDEIIEAIDKIDEFFAECEDSLSTLQIETLGGLPSSLGNASIQPPHENVENPYDLLDLVLDSFWFYFQAIMGSCYPKAPPSRTKSLLDVYRTFTKYYLEPFQERWFKVSKNFMDYGLIIGDVDLIAAYTGLRACAIGAFIKNNISELYFPRPLYIDDGIRVTINQFDSVSY